MRKPLPDPSWPASWHLSYSFDLAEVFGTRSNVGYCCSYACRSKSAIEKVCTYAAPGASVLDVAAGQGNFTLALAEMGFEVTWNDLRDDLIGYVKEKQKDGVVHYAPGDLFSLDEGNVFDIVLMTEIIEHVAHPDRFLQKAARLLKPGGFVIMTTPNGEYFQYHFPKFSECPAPAKFECEQFKPNSDGHIFLLHIDEIGPLAAQAGLSVVETQLISNTLTNGYMGTRVMLRLLPTPFWLWVDSLAQKLPLALGRRINTTLVAVLQLV